MRLNVNDIELDEELVLSRRRKFPDVKPPFTMFGNGILNKTGQSMDIIEELTQLTPASIKLFQVMLRKRCVDTNRVVLKPSEMESPRLITNHMPLLIEKGLVLRTANCRYMINPMLVIPNNYRSAKLQWDSLNNGLSAES